MSSRTANAGNHFATPYPSESVNLDGYISLATSHRPVARVESPPSGIAALCDESTGKLLTIPKAALEMACIDHHILHDQSSSSGSGQPD